MPKNFCYLRVSTTEQDLDKFRADILQFANDRDFGRVEFIQETISGKKPWRDRKLGRVVDGLAAGDRLIVPELSRLGRSTLEILEIMKIIKDSNAVLYAVKGGWQLDDSIQSKIISMVFAMMAEIERDLISERTREALAAKRAAGVKLGRPAGPGKSKLDQYAEEIKALIENGSTKIFIAKKFNTTPQNLNNWLKKHKIS